MHSAILPTNNHAIIAFHAVPGNPGFAASTVMIQDVSFDDASKITELVARHGLSSLVWEPPITQPAAEAAPTPTPPPAAAEPSSSLPDEPT